MFSKAQSLFSQIIMFVCSFFITALFTISSVVCDGLFEEGKSLTMAENFYNTIGIPIIEIGWIPLIVFAALGFFGDEQKSKGRLKIALLILVIYVLFLLGGAFAYGTINGLAQAIVG